MSDELIAGVRFVGPVTLKDILSEVIAKTEREVQEIQELGLEVTHATFVNPQSAARIFFKFPAGRMQWEVRKDLEAKLYDVGQQLGANELSFYASKRVTKNRGWDE